MITPPPHPSTAPHLLLIIVLIRSLLHLPINSLVLSSPLLTSLLCYIPLPLSLFLSLSLSLLLSLSLSLSLARSEEHTSALHSLPTRRSPDLLSSPLLTSLLCYIPLPLSLFLSLSLSLLLSLSLSLSLARSEAHTSELQS